MTNLPFPKSQWEMTSARQHAIERNVLWKLAGKKIVSLEKQLDEAKAEYEEECKKTIKRL